MTIKSAKKVAKRGWSFEKFSKAVSARCKAREIPVKKVKSTTMRECYDKGVTVADTVTVIAGA